MTPNHLGETILKKSRNRIILILIFLIIPSFSDISLLNKIDTSLINVVESPGYPKLSSPNIDILVPRNRTYMKDSNHFRCSYDFDNFAEVDDSSGRIDELDGHKNVYKMDYGSDLILGLDVLDSLFPAPNIGSVEFYFRTEDATDETEIYFEMGGEPVAPIYFFITDDNWWYGEYPYLQLPINLAGGYKPKDNFWHHIKIDFECNNERWKLTVDGYSSSWLSMFIYPFPEPPPFLRLDYIFLRSLVRVRIWLG